MIKKYFPHALLTIYIIEFIIAGINPYSRAGLGGKGLSSKLADKLSKIQPVTGVPRKNIVMSM